MTCCATPADIRGRLEDVHAIETRLERDRMLSNSVKLDGTKYKTDFIVPDMHCAACINAIERGLSELSFVEKVRVNLTQKTVSVIWDADAGDPMEISAKLSNLGFAHHLGEETEQDRVLENSSRFLLLCLAVAGFAAANIMLLSVSVWSGADGETAQFFHLLSGLIAVPAVAFSGQPFFRSAINALRVGRLNMDVPISLAVILAVGMSLYESLVGGGEAYFDAGVTLLFFLLIGRYLDHVMRKKAQGAVERLSALSAKSGIQVHQNGDIDHIELNDIKPGMILRVFAGERFPVNGKIIAGKSDIDRSHITGESESVLAKIGTFVEAGTLNLSASLDFEATTSAENSFLAEMQKMMTAAENGRSEYIRIADRMARIYAPGVHLLALIAFLYWMFASGGDWHLSIYTAVAVLIVTCPCALGLAVPVAHVIGANRLMQNGILMRDGTALERLAVTDTVVFDKTGTLTKGSPVVCDVQGDLARSAGLIKTLAMSSSHPISKAIRKLVQDANQLPIDNVKEVPGFGIEGCYKNQIVRLGKSAWVSELSASHKTEACETFNVCFAISGSDEMVRFKTEDEVREGARKAVQDLQNHKFRLEILSGDNAQNVRMTADMLGIEEAYFGKTPSEKIEHINELHSQGHHVLMVGDGVNDAPALAAGNVSMVPSTASDIGRHSADFVFTRPSLTAVPFAIDIAKLTDRIVKQNFGLAIAYNCIAIPLAMSGHVTPLVAAIAMSASSILVIANSLRINFTEKNFASKPKPHQSAFGRRRAIG